MFVFFEAFFLRMNLPWCKGGFGMFWEGDVQIANPDLLIPWRIRVGFVFKKQDGSHEPECIHVLGLRMQTSAIGKRTFFCMHRALIPSQRRRLSNSSQREN